MGHIGRVIHLMAAQAAKDLEKKEVTQAEPDATGDSDRSSHYVNESERTLLGGYNPEDLRLGKRKVLGR